MFNEKLQFFIDMTKKYYKIVVFTLVVALFVWYFWSDPTSNLSETPINQIGVYSHMLKPSLTDLGYGRNVLIKIPDNNLEFGGIFNEASTKKIIHALKEKSRGYYIYKSPNDVDTIYALNFKFNENEGYTFLISNLAAAAKGKFYGYKYTSKISTNGRNLKWIAYTNQELGRVLEELRRK